MKEIKTTIYECEFCRKYYKRKHFAIKLENLCPLNPANNPKCYSCEYLKKVDVNLIAEIEVSGHYGGVEYAERERTYSLLKCTKKDVFIKPIISHKKGKCFEPNLISEIEMIVAPLECNIFNDCFKMDDLPNFLKG